jgi:hypothetical protein
MKLSLRDLSNVYMGLAKAGLVGSEALANGCKEYTAYIRLWLSAVKIYFL